MTMNITTNKTSIRTIRSDDPRFNIIDKYVMVKRAGFEIDQMCPKTYKAVIVECINNGWLKPVAHMTERELLFVGLNENE